MDTTIIVVIAIIVAFAVLVIKTRKGQASNDLESEAKPTKPETAVPGNEYNRKDNIDKPNSDYQFYVGVAKEMLDSDDVMEYEFSLFNTRAATVWVKGSELITIVCLKAFSNGMAASNSYDTFEYNLYQNYWAGFEPKGCKQPIKEMIEYLKVQHNISFHEKVNNDIEEKKAHLQGLMRNRYELEVKIDLFNTEAFIYYSPEKSIVHIVCIERFRKQKAASEHYDLFRYHLSQKHWLESPIGAAKELGKLVLQHTAT